MPVKFVYKGNLFGSGNMHNIPRTGDFFKANGNIYRIEAVMYSNGPNGIMFAVLYLVDVMPATEEKLKYC